MLNEQGTPLTLDQICLEIDRLDDVDASEIKLDLELNETDIVWKLKEIKHKIKALIWYINSNNTSISNNKESHEMISGVRKTLENIRYEYFSVRKKNLLDLYTYGLFLHHRNGVLPLLNELIEIGKYISLINNMKKEVRKDRDSSRSLFSSEDEQHDYALQELRNSPNKERLISMYYFYKGIEISKENYHLIASRCEVKAGHKLGQMYCDVKDTSQRIKFSRFPTDFRIVYFLLHRDAREKADEDISLYKKEYGKELIEY